MAKSFMSSFKWNTLYYIGKVLGTWGGDPVARGHTALIVCCSKVTGVGMQHNIAVKYKI